MNYSLIDRNRIDLLRAFLILIFVRRLILSISQRERETFSINKKINWTRIDITSKRAIKVSKIFFIYLKLSNYLISTISFHLQFRIFEKNFLPLRKARLQEVL